MSFQNRLNISPFGFRTRVEANIAENRITLFGEGAIVGEAKRGIGHAVGFKDNDWAGNKYPKEAIHENNILK